MQAQTSIPVNFFDHKYDKLSGGKGAPSLGLSSRDLVLPESNIDETVQMMISKCKEDGSSMATSSH